MKKVKRFKLIKEYPGSPKLGTIITGFHNNTLYAIPNGQSIIEDFINSQTEFWQEVDENNSEYEILAFMYQNYGSVWTKQEDGKFYPKDEYNRFHGISGFRGTPESWFLSFPDQWKIYSVKRFNDKEIFTIGDTCCPVTARYNRLPVISIKFVDLGNLRLSSKNYCMNISSLEKCRKIFTTEDGVDIYNGERWYSINGDNNIVECQHYLKFCKSKRFSTKEKAEEYLESLQPKVLFKTVDGKEIFKGDRFFVHQNRIVHEVFGQQYQTDKWQNFRYSTRELAEEAVIRKTPCLSFEDLVTIIKSVPKRKELYNLAKEKLRP